MKNINYDVMTVEELRNYAKLMGLVDYSNLEKAELIALISANAIPVDSIVTDTTVNGPCSTDKPVNATDVSFKYLSKDFTEGYYKELAHKELSDEEIEKVKAFIIREANFYSVEPVLTWQNICNSIADAREMTFSFKREQIEVIQLNVSSVEYESDKGFFFDSSKAVAITDFGNKEEASNANAIVKVKVTNTRSIKVADNHNQTMLIFKSTPNSNNILPKYVTPEHLNDTSITDILTAIYTNGITDIATNKFFMPAVQSASQARKGDLWFLSVTSKDTDEFGFNHEIECFRQETMNLDVQSYHDFMSNMILMAKAEARVGLGVSSVLDIKQICKQANNSKTFELIHNWNVKVIKDINAKTTLNTVTIGEKPWDFKYNKNVSINTCVSDGSGLISLKACLALNHAMGIISDADFKYAMTEWKKIDYDFSQITPDTKFGQFLHNKVRNAFQIRRAVDKGLIVCQPRIDGNAKSKDIDFYMFESMAKFETDWKNGQLEICAVNKPKKEQAKLNFQFINALNIKTEYLINAVKEALAPIKNDYLTKWESAMEFLGAISRFSDSEEDKEDVTIDKLKTILITNCQMLDDTWVQNKLMEKCEKFVREMAFGRIPVEGAFHYIVTDPNYLFSQIVEEEIAHLGKNEVYFNNEECNATGFRSPLVQQSEARGFKCVANASLFFWRDLVVLNPYDGIAPAMGGADFDGDKILLLLTNKSKFNQVIFDSLADQHYIIYDEGISGKKVENTYANRVKHYVSTAESDLTGQITNNATIFRDMWFNEMLLHGNTEKAKFYNRSVFNLRFNQGWQIDKAKTGVGAEGLNGKMYPKELTPKFKPHWFVGMRKYQNRQVATVDKKTGKSLIYISKSPIGQCYDYVTKFWDELKASVRSEKNAKYTLLAKGVDITKSKSIVDKVISLEKSYVRQITSLVKFRNSFEMDKKDFMDSLSVLNNQYGNILMSMIDYNSGITEDVIAYTAYYATYHKENNQSRSRSFVWNCMFDSMKKLLLKGNNSYELKRIKSKELVPVSIENGFLIVNNRLIGKVDYADQKCEVFTAKDGTNFAIVKKIQEVTTPANELASSDKSYALQLNGFRYYNLNSESFIELVKANNNQFEVLSDNNGNSKVAVGGKIVGAVKDLMNNMTLLGKTLFMISHGSLTYIANDSSTLNRKSTIVKDKDKHECYCGQIDVVCSILGDSTTKLVTESESFSEENYVPSYDDSYSIYDCSYIDGVTYEY